MVSHVDRVGKNIIEQELNENDLKKCVNEGIIYRHCI